MDANIIRDEKFWKLSKAKYNYYNEYLGVINYDDTRFLVKKGNHRCPILGVFEGNLEVIGKANFVIDLEDGRILKNRYGGIKYNDLELAIEAREWNIKC